MSEPILKVDGFVATLHVVEVAGREALQDTWYLDVNCVCAVRPSDVASVFRWIGAKADLSLPGGRSWSGMVDEVSYEDRQYTFRLVPTLKMFEDDRDYKIILEAVSTDTAQEFLEGLGYQVDRQLDKEPEPRPQRAQYSEPTLSFVDRLLAEDGILWFFDPNDDQKLILTDRAKGFVQYETTRPLTLVDNDEAETGGIEVTPVTDAKVIDRVVPQRVSLTDWNYKTPGVDISASHAKDGGDSIGEWHHHANYGEQSKGKATAERYLTAHRRDATRLTATISVTDLGPGHIVELKPAEGQLNKSPRTDKWLVVDVLHEGVATTGVWQHEVKIVAVPAASGYRPIVPPVYRASGLQTMVVVGKDGEEIHTDEDGRAMVKHRWDLEHGEDDTASAWHRVVQPAMPGALLLPRTGFEAVTSFRGSVGDEPFLLGRLDNGVAAPNQSLPARKVASNFGSASTPGGGGTSGISTDDTSGSQAMTTTAQYNYDESTGNDKKSTIVGTDKLQVGTDRTTTIGQGQIEEVGGARSITVGARRKVNVESNINVQAGDEVVAIGGARIFNIGGDQVTECNIHARGVVGAKVEACVESESRKVLGAMGVMIGGSCTQLAGLSYGLNVAGKTVEKVAGSKGIAAKSYGMFVAGKVEENISGNSKQKASSGVVNQFKGDLNIDVGGAIDAKGSNVLFKAKTITIKANGVTVKIADGKIKVDGKADFNSDAVQKTDTKI